jgi:hypothetical protein
MKWSWKAPAVLAAVSATVLVLSTSAFAVGAGPSSAPGQLKTSVGPATWSGGLSALAPGVPNDTELLRFTVINAGRVAERVSSVVTAMRATPDGDAETAAGADIRGCRASWFSVSTDPRDRQLPARIAPGGSYAGTVDLVMHDSATNQDACENSSPAFTVTAG